MTAGASGSPLSSSGHVIVEKNQSLINVSTGSKDVLQ